MPDLLARTLLRRSLVAAIAVCVAGAAFAQTPGTAVAPRTTHLPGFITGQGVLDAEKPDLVMTVRAGVRFSPAYMGASEGKFGPDAGLRFDYIQFPGGFTMGSNETVGFQTGFGLRLSARYIRGRDSNDYPEIRGLDDIPTSFEAGLGLGYEQRNYRAFADMRYGIIGHHAWAGDIGADGIAYPIEGLSLTLGPRMSFGSDNFVETYFGISPSESAASGLPVHETSGGLYGAGVEVAARYLFNERWGVEGVARWTRLLDDAANSPITEDGSADQYRVRFDLTRRISLDF